MRSRVIGAALACALAFGGCSDDADGEPDATPSSDATGSVTTPSATESPSTAPATGELIEFEPYSVRLVEDVDWVRGEPMASVEGATAIVDDAAGLFDVMGGALRHTDGRFDDYAAVREENSRTEAIPLTREPDRYVNGVRVFVLSGTADGQSAYQVGTVHAGYETSLEFEYPADFAPAQDWIEAMLASIEWA